MTIGETAFAAVDFESAGVRKGGTDVPVQIGIAQMRGGVIAAEEFFVSHLATDQPITWSAQKVHGITTQDLRGAPDFLQLWPQVKDRLANRWIVAHGAATEKRFLRAYPFHGFGPWVDTLKLARAVWPDLPSFSLGDVVRSRGLEDELREICPETRWHDALFDAVASLVLLRRVIAEADLTNEPAERLLQADDSFYHRNKKRR